MRLPWVFTTPVEAGCVPNANDPFILWKQFGLYICGISRYFSTDSGNTWIKGGPFLSAFSAYFPILGHKTGLADSTTYFSFYGPSIYKLNYQNGKWTKLNSIDSVDAICSYNKDLYAISKGSLLVSADSGNTWNDVSDELTGFTELSITGNYIYITITDGTKYRKYVGNDTQMESTSDWKPVSCHISAYPNPFTPSTILSYQALADGKVQLYDIAGKMVWQTHVKKGRRSCPVERRQHEQPASVSWHLHSAPAER